MSDGRPLSQGVCPSLGVANENRRGGVQKGLFVIPMLRGDLCRLSFKQSKLAPGKHTIKKVRRRSIMVL
jgi:hypothetical protein